MLGWGESDRKWIQSAALKACGMVLGRSSFLRSFPRLSYCVAILLIAACTRAQETRELPEAPSAVEPHVLPTAEDASPQNPSPEEAPKPAAEEQHPSAIGKVKDLPDKVKVLPSKIKDQPIVWLIGPYVSQQTALTPLTLRERREVYVRQTYLNAGAYFARGFAAGIDQARGIPYEWGGGIGGYGKRYASHFGQFAIGNSLVAAGNAVLGYEPRYDVCRCTGFWPRTRHAIVRNFVTYNQTEQQLRPQIPLYGGTFAAGVIASTWKPANNRSAWKDGMYASLAQAGYGVAVNWVREFALDILRKSGAKK